MDSNKNTPKFQSGDEVSIIELLRQITEKY
jgi:hypothetical protein